MKNTTIEIPAVAWWALAALLIPVLQAWIGQTFPGSSFVWAPLAVAALGAVLKWISWLMAQNNQQLPTGEEGTDPKPANMGIEMTGEPYLLEWEPPQRRFDAVEFLFGVKRA